jgi:hypothetical protein
MRVQGILMRGPMQLRGHCQCCGREQAVIDGRIAVHGADLRCPGSQLPPLQAQREFADRTIAHVRSEAWTIDDILLDYDVQSEVGLLKQYARHAREFADELARIADECFCEPLRQVCA